MGVAVGNVELAEKVRRGRGGGEKREEEKRKTTSEKKKLINLSFEKKKNSENQKTGALRQHPDGGQLPGLAAQEELAERGRALHQVDDGQARAPVLEERFLEIWRE